MTGHTWIAFLVGAVVGSASTIGISSFLMWRKWKKIERALRGLTLPGTHNPSG